MSSGDLPTSAIPFPSKPIALIAGYVSLVTGSMTFCLLLFTLLGVSEKFCFRVKERRHKGVIIPKELSSYRILCIKTTIRPFLLLLVVSLFFATIAQTASALRRLPSWTNSDPFHLSLCAIVARLQPVAHACAKFAFIQFLYTRARTFYESYEGNSGYMLGFKRFTNVASVLCSIAVVISGNVNFPVITNSTCQFSEPSNYYIAWITFNWVTDLVLAVFFFKPLFRHWMHSQNEDRRAALGIIVENMIIGFVMLIISPMVQSLFRYFAVTNQTNLATIFSALANAFDLAVNCVMQFISSRKIWETNPVYWSPFHPDHLERLVSKEDLSDDLKARGKKKERKRRSAAKRKTKHEKPQDALNSLLNPTTHSEHSTPMSSQPSFGEIKTPVLSQESPVLQGPGAAKALQRNKTSFPVESKKSKSAGRSKSKSVFEVTSDMLSQSVDFVADLKESQENLGDSKESSLSGGETPDKEKARSKNGRVLSQQELMMIRTSLRTSKSDADEEDGDDEDEDEESLEPAERTVEVDMKLENMPTESCEFESSKVFSSDMSSGKQTRSQTLNLPSRDHSPNPEAKNTWLQRVFASQARP
jgi:hypothetical protein